MKNERLNLFLAKAGVCSRREADALIKAGEVTINHWPVTDPAYLVQEKDTVRYRKKIVTPTSQNVYVVLNKPKGFVTTVSDEKKRATVLDLLGKKIKTRIYPIGRLDINTTGVLLLTNDGTFAQQLIHPKFGVTKIYQVTLTSVLNPDHMATIQKGLRLDNEKITVDDISQASNPFKVRVVLHSGKNRVVRRIFEHFGYTIKKLERVSFGGISCKGVPLGGWRFLKQEEVQKLQNKSASALKAAVKKVSKK